MSRLDSHPVAFAAAESIADQPSCVLIAWETAGALKWRTYPGASLAVLIGLHSMLADAINAMTPDEDDEPDDDDE